jgi:flagellar basal-body rod modification protein FlgD
MTSISPLLNTAATSGTGTGTSTTSTNTGLLSPTDFMTLLVSQLQNQDPTAPMDPNQFMNQLVSFNSLETQLGMKQDLDTLTTAVGGTGTSGTGTSGAGGTNNTNDTNNTGNTNNTGTTGVS